MFEGAAGAVSSAMGAAAEQQAAAQARASSSVQTAAGLQGLCESEEIARRVFDRRMAELRKAKRHLNDSMTAAVRKTSSVRG